MAFTLCRRLAGIILPLFIASVLEAQTIPNPSFEANGDFSVAPGYASGNGGVITGWTMSDPTRTGINTTNGAFCNNGIIPSGTHVAFLQSTGTNNSFSTTITGLTSGATYQVTFRANCRATYGAPTNTWSLNGGAFVSFTSSPSVNPNGVRTNPFYTNSATFTATNTTAALVLRNQTTGDTTTLIDDFTIALIAAAQSAPTVTTLAATGVSNTVAQLNGTVNPQSSSTTVWFEWGLSPYTNSTTTTPVNVGNGSVSVTASNAVSGLTPGLNYHCRLVASNALGVVRGNDVTFGPPSVTLKVAATLTNECHAAFTDPYAANPVTAIGAPLAISAGNALSLGLRADGTVAVWGDNTYGQTNIPAGLSNVVAIDGQNWHTVALKSDGTVVAWGAGTTDTGSESEYGQSIVPAGLSNVVAVAAGYDHSVALKSNGRVVVWGDHNISTTTNVPSTLTNAMAIAAGHYHTTALTSNGTVVVWGRTNEGQAIIPSNLTNVIAIAAGDYHNLALKDDGTVVAWGAGKTNTGTSPQYGQSIVPAGLSNVVAITAGANHSMALKSDGTIAIWGSNSAGQTNIPASVTNVVAMAGGVNHSLALKADGTLVGWGLNIFSILSAPTGLTNLTVTATAGGNFNTNNSPGSYQYTYFVTNFLGGTGSVSRTVVVQDTGKPVITMLGNNPLTNAFNVPFVDPGATALDACAGSVAISNTNSTVNVSVPGSYTVTYTATDSSSNTTNAVRTVVVSPGAPTVTTLSATGVSNTVATLNGTAIPNGAATTTWFEWGLSSVSNTNTTAPVSVGNGLGSVPISSLLSSLTPGVVYHYRAVASNSVGVVRGNDFVFGSPELSLNGAAAVTNECHAPFNDPGATMTAEPLLIAAGGQHSVAVKSGATLVAWGNNPFGQTNVPVGLTAVAVSAGGNHNLAIKSDGTVAAWGYNNSGQINVPGGLNNVISVAAEGDNSLALKSDGTMVHWGANMSGALNIPGGLSNVVGIAAGNIHNTALKSDGTVSCWGYGVFGQTAVPPGLNSVAAIAGGSYHTLALKSNATVVAWGDNTGGQTNVPGGLNSVVAISAGSQHSLALKSNGTVVAWGSNTYGQSTVPAGLSNVVAISAGDDFNLALKNDGTIVAWGRSAEGQTILPAILTNLTATASGSVDTNTPGTYQLTYTVTNSLGGIATASRTVVVKDTLPPIITVLGSNPFTNAPNVPFNDPGAAALDACGGSFAVTTNNLVNVAVSGTYTVTYTATDSFGNSATNTRTVVVPFSPILSVSNLTASNAMFISFQITNGNGASFTVLASTNVADPMNVWSNLGTATEIPLGSGQFQFTDPQVTNNPQRFYRVRTP